MCPVPNHRSMSRLVRAIEPLYLPPRSRHARFVIGTYDKVSCTVAIYTPEGSKVLSKEKVTVREAFARNAIEASGEK